MAKQRKLLYPTGPDTFFDEMEREVNSTKRKKCKQINQVPPEKLFLQFDPSKKEDVCSSKKVVNSQPLLMQKTYWKPPIKMLSQSGSFESSKKLVRENNDKNKENICSKSNENVIRADFSNDDNIKIISNSLEANKSENGENAEKGEENVELIIINSSPETPEKNSSETEKNDSAPNNCSERGYLCETTGEVVVLDSKTETAIHKIQECEENTVNINTSQKEAVTVTEDCMQRLASDANCYFEIKKPTIPSINLNIFQDINAIISEGECPDIIKGKMSKLSDKNNVNESSEALDEGKLSPNEDILKEGLKTDIGQQNNNNNLQLTQCGGKLKSQIVETISLETDMTANSKKSLESKINSSDVLDEGNLSPKEDILKEDLDTEIGWQNNKNNLNPTQCGGKVKFEIVEVLSTTIMTANTENSGKSEIVGLIENTVSKTGILSAPENSKSNHSKKQGQDKIAQIDTEQFDSVFEDVSPTENQNSKKLEIATEPNEDEININVPCNVAMPEQSCITTELASDVYTAVDVTNQNILLMNKDNNDSVNQNFEQENNNMSNNVYENLGSNTNHIGENETNVIEENEHLTKDCNIENNDTVQRNCSENEVGEGEKEENTNEFEQILEVENKILEEKEDMDEEYSCLMISNSQLAEIEKNYYESSQHKVENKVSKVSGTDYNNENKINYYCSNTEGKIESGNVIGPQTEFGPRNSSVSILQNIPPKLPSVQWPKKMLEAQMKIRDLVGEVERLNSLLMGFRREIWPQKHSDNPST